MKRNIFRTMKEYFHRKVSEIKTEYESKIGNSHGLCIFTEEEYSRFKKISRENDKFVC